MMSVHLKSGTNNQLGSSHSALYSSYFINVNQEDPKTGDPKIVLDLKKPMAEFCSDFKAGREYRQNASSNGKVYSGIFGASCSHGIGYLFAGMFFTVLEL
jgi:hypothetical protein